MGCCGGGGGDAAASARASEEERQRQIDSAVGNINTAFAGFDPAFYNNRAKAYQDFALPQLGEQYQDTARNLSYRLANQHMLDSSGARFLTNTLDRETAKQRQGIVDESLRQGQQLRKDIAQEKTGLINQAQVAADPALAQQAALASASSFTQPSAFAPVSNFLQGWANTYLANQVANAYNNNNNGSNHSNGTSFAVTPTFVQGR